MDCSSSVAKRSSKLKTKWNCKNVDVLVVVKFDTKEVLLLAYCLDNKIRLKMSLTESL